MSESMQRTLAALRRSLELAEVTRQIACELGDPRIVAQEAQQIANLRDRIASLEAWDGTRSWPGAPPEQLEPPPPVTRIDRLARAHR